MAMNTTLVINAKGGVGKTTITTNLASYFASRDVPTTIADFDPQGSSLNWLSLRSSASTKIHGADLAPRNGSGLSVARRQIPRETKQLIVDAPAGPSRLLLQDLLSRTQSILIPVAPSSGHILPSRTNPSTLATIRKSSAPAWRRARTKGLSEYFRSLIWKAKFQRIKRVAFCRAAN